MENAIPPSPENNPTEGSIKFLSRLKQGVQNHWKEIASRTFELALLVPFGTTAGLAIEKIIHVGANPQLIAIAVANSLAVLGGAAVFEPMISITKKPSIPIST